MRQDGVILNQLRLTAVFIAAVAMTPCWAGAASAAPQPLAKTASKAPSQTTTSLPKTFPQKNTNGKSQRDKTKAAPPVVSTDEKSATEQFEANIQKANKILATHPNDAGAFAFRGEAYKMLGQYEPALADFTKAIDLNGTKDIYFAERAKIYGIKRKYPDAIRDVDDAIKLAPNNPAYHSFKGLLCAASGQDNDAIESLTAAIKLHPNERDFCLRAQVFIKLNKMDLAKSDLEQALKFEPNSAAAAQVKKALESHVAPKQ